MMKVSTGHWENTKEGNTFNTELGGGKFKKDQIKKTAS